MLSKSFVSISSRLAGKERLVAVAGIVVAAAAALIFGDSHSIGMTHN